jgi:hypothetical protein
MSACRIFLLLFLLTFPVLCAQAESVQARLIRASMDDAPSDAELRDVLPQLKGDFGYASYKIVGQKTAPLIQGETHDMELGEGFRLRVTAVECKGQTNRLRIELFQGNALLLKNTAKLAARSSLLIRIAEVGSELVIVAVKVLP